MSDEGWRPYVPVAARRRKAAKETAKLAKKGTPASPVTISGRAIARTFWGKAWCENLERYSDYANRLPRGRTYVRNGSVVDLKITADGVAALVSGSRLYRVEIVVAPVPKERWRSICRDCAGAIDSLVELLQGRFSEGVMERLCVKNTGLFPVPSEIRLACSCPDWASMCKHVAAVLYGIGARLDERPELLFTLRQVDEKELIAQAGKALPIGRKAPAAQKVLPSDGLAELFGLDLGGEEAAPRPSKTRAKPKPKAKPLAKAKPLSKAKQPTKGKPKPAKKPPVKAKPSVTKKPRPAAKLPAKTAKAIPAARRPGTA